MAHWRTLLESDVIRYVDLTKEHVVQIKKVIGKQKITGAAGKQSKGKALIYFEGHEKPLSAGTEILSLIAGMHGEEPAKWVGCWLTLFPDPHVMYGGKKVGGVRPRPTPPAPELRVLPSLKETK